MQNNERLKNRNECRAPRSKFKEALDEKERKSRVKTRDGESEVVKSVSRMSQAVIEVRERKMKRGKGEGERERAWYV